MSDDDTRPWRPATYGEREVIILALLRLRQDSGFDHLITPLHDLIRDDGLMLRPYRPWRPGLTGSQPATTKERP